MKYQNIMPQISFNYTAHFSCWKKLRMELIQMELI